jgi:uncharacterized NAD(P)/FAD-binding protein YdhS
MRIAIVGGGATGALVGLHLIRALGDRSIEIIVIEPAAEIGRGVAYSTADQRHLLNVRAGNMSAFADQPDHLFQWLEARGSINCTTPFCFIPRGLYGTYLADLVRQPLLSGSMRHIHDVCVDLSECGDRVRLLLKSGEAVVADLVVFATGSPKRVFLKGVPVVQAWADSALREPEPERSILIVGSGLTMVDQALSLERQGHCGKITVLSYHGLLPAAHRSIRPYTIGAGQVPFGAELSQVMRWLRGLISELRNEGYDWRSAIDALRPHTQRLWRSMSPMQKRRFLRHLRAYWDVLRHRMAPEVEEQINGLRAGGRLEILSGRILHAEEGPKGVSVTIRKRGGSERVSLSFGRVIDCTGLSVDFHQSDNELVKTLLACGTARLDPLGIGLDVSEDYALVNGASMRMDKIRVAGPLARATFWECIAIPDIRLQCAHLAEIVATNFARRSACNSGLPNLVEQEA